MVSIKDFWSVIKSTRELRWADLVTVLPLIPGGLLILIGLALLCAPSYLLLLTSVFVICLGVLFAFSAWWTVGLLSKFKRVAGECEARIYVQGFGLRPADSEFDQVRDPKLGEQKKIVYH